MTRFARVARTRWRAVFLLTGAVLTLQPGHGAPLARLAVHQGLKTRHPGGSADHWRSAGEAGKPAGQASLARTAARAGQAHSGQDLLDRVVNRLFLAGLGLQSVADLPHELAMRPIAEALQRLDDTIREIRDRVFAARARDGPADPAPRNGPG